MFFVLWRNLLSKAGHLFIASLFCLNANAAEQKFIVSKETMKKCAFEKTQTFKECCLNNAVRISNEDTSSETQNTSVNHELSAQEACITANNGTTTYWDNEKNTCITQSGGGNRWGAIWDSETKKYKCMNAIEFADYEFEHGLINEAQKKFRYETFKDIIFDQNGKLTPANTDLQWYTKPKDEIFPTASKCASLNERQCYQQKGGFDWDDYGNGKCYTHDNDKSLCESFGAKFTTKNNISYCDCKIKNKNLEFHWNSSDVCNYKKDNTTYGYQSSFSIFFEVCLENKLKNSPIFDGKLKNFLGKNKKLKCL